jgi:hypothetical protein
MSKFGTDRGQNRECDPEDRVPFFREKIMPKHKARPAGRGTRGCLRHDQFKEKCGK